MYKTWIEINKKAIAHNAKVIRKHLAPNTQLWSVIKSNAYGHGLLTFAQYAADLKINDRPAVDGFCVDSVIEGVKLRTRGIEKPILVLGPTLPDLIHDAAAHDITLSISTFEALNELVKGIKDPNIRPQIHLKVDTGMNRQGFFVQDLEKAFAFIKRHKIKITGIFSHLAAAKDTNYLTFSKNQLAAFEAALKIAKKHGYAKLTRHIAATAGLMLAQNYHFDVVRSGIGLYGLHSSMELDAQLGKEYPFIPVLSWHSILSEIKKVPKNSFIGYDLTERLTRNSTIAIVPIGYWHGLPWALGRQGYMLVNGKRCKILGRVSMDMTAIDITGIKAKVGDKATIIGRQGKEEITAREIALAAHTTPYEIITRINPLIHRKLT